MQLFYGVPEDIMCKMWDVAYTRLVGCWILHGASTRCTPARSLRRLMMLAGLWKTISARILMPSELLWRFAGVRWNTRKINTFDYAEMLAEPIQCFADVLEKDLNASK